MKKFTEKEFSDCFLSLYKNYSGRIYNYMLHISHGDRYKAEEVIQITFMKLWQKRDTIDSLETMKSYLFTIAKNVFLNICEHEAIEYTYFNHILKNSNYHTNNTEETIENDFMVEYINDIVKDLTPMRRLVYHKHYVEHMPYKQIAAELGISVNTIEVHIVQALRFIREELRKRYNIMATVLAVAITSIL